MWGLRFHIKAYKHQNLDTFSDKHTLLALCTFKSNSWEVFRITAVVKAFLHHWLLHSNRSWVLYRTNKHTHLGLTHGIYHETLVAGKKCDCLTFWFANIPPLPVSENSHLRPCLTTQHVFHSSLCLCCRIQESQTPFPFTTTMVLNSPTTKRG